MGVSTPLTIIFLNELSLSHYIPQLKNHYFDSRRKTKLSDTFFSHSQQANHILLSEHPVYSTLLQKKNKTGKCLSTEYTPSHAASHMCVLSHTHRPTVYMCTRRTQATQVYGQGSGEGRAISRWWRGGASGEQGWKTLYNFSSEIYSPFYKNANYYTIFFIIIRFELEVESSSHPLKLIRRA